MLQPRLESESSNGTSHHSATLQNPETKAINSSSPASEQRQTSSRTISWVQSPLASALDTNFQPPSTHPGSSLSDLFIPFPTHLGARELAYLESHDALSVPSEELQVQLLQAYIEFVHGAMPVLDLEHFLSVVKYGSLSSSAQNTQDTPASNRISFLLFQAVMFAASGYVSTRVLIEAGYTSRESAKRIFFNRVKVSHILRGNYWHWRTDSVLLVIVRF